jgi:hypothetical protein
MDNRFRSSCELRGWRDWGSVQAVVDLFMPYVARFRLRDHDGVRERRDGPKVVSTVQMERRAYVGREFKVMRKG